MTAPYYTDDQVTLHCGDALEVLRTLPDESASCVVTSPPYYNLRDYDQPGQYGLEPTPAAYVETMRAVFAEVRRVLTADGTLWLNLGDSYDGKKNLLGVPWRVAFALQDDGWILRSDITWHKPNAMPESVTDRPSCSSEHLFLFAKSSRYWFDLDAVREPLLCPDALDGTRMFGGRIKGTAGGVGSTERRRGHNAYGATPPGHTGGPKNGGPGPHHDAVNPKGRNPGDVWSVSTSPFPEAHFAVMAPYLARRCIVAGCRPGGVVLDPFAGSCTTGMVALKHGRRFVGIDLSPAYLDLALRTRLAQGALIPEETP